jgi:hypothetical protein
MCGSIGVTGNPSSANSMPGCAIALLRPHRLCVATGHQVVFGSAPHQSSRLTTSEGRVRPCVQLCASDSVHSGSHSSLGSSQSVRLNRAKGNVSRRGPARSSLRCKARILYIELDRSTHPLPISGLSVVHPSQLVVARGSKHRHGISDEASFIT